VLNWSYNKSVISQSLDNSIGSLPIDQRIYNFTTPTPITSNHSFTVSGHDGTQGADATATIGFYKRRYWGTIPSSQNALPTNAQLLSGSSELAANRNKSIKYDCSTPSGGQYFYYAYSSVYDISDVTVNGFPFSDWFDPINPSIGTVTPVTVSVTGQYGYIENYLIYRVYNPQHGAAIPVVYG
jgi:hypothetical protein